MYVHVFVVSSTKGKIRVVMWVHLAGLHSLSIFAIDRSLRNSVCMVYDCKSVLPISLGLLFKCVCHLFLLLYIPPPPCGEMNFGEK
jgi:hypothetical protein